MAADSYTTILGLILQGTGNNDNTWGDNLNNYAIQYIEDAIAGRSSISVTSSDVTLTAAQARSAILDCSGTLTGNRNLIVPNASKKWTIRNNCSGSFTLSVKTSSGSAVEIPQGGWCDVWCNGSNVVYVSPSTAKHYAQADGTAALPYYSFASDPDSGWYRIGANNLGVAVNGAKVLDIATTGLSIVGTLSPSGQILAADGSAAAPSGAFASDPDTGWYRIGANNMGFAVGGSKVLDVSAAGLAVTGAMSASGLLSGGSLSTSGAAALTGGGSFSGTFSGTFTLSGAVTIGGSIDLGSSAIASTQSATDDSTKVATTAFAQAKKVKKLHVRDIKTFGTNGGTFTQATDVQRTLNQVVTNTISGASLSSNRVTLPNGVYDVKARAPAYGVAGHKAFLWNVTDDNMAILGSVEFCGDEAQTNSEILGRLTVSGGPKIYEIRHRSTGTTVENYGLGSATSSYDEVYTEAIFETVPD